MLADSAAFSVTAYAPAGSPVGMPLARSEDILLELPQPLVVLLPRAPGAREARWTHLLCGPVDTSQPAAAAETATNPGGPISPLAQRVTALETEVAQLRALVDDMAAQLGLSPPGHPESNDRA